MSAFVWVFVYDWYNCHKRTRVRCHSGRFGLSISMRQFRDAKRRVGLISGSVLRADYDTDIYVYDSDGNACGFIGCSF